MSKFEAVILLSPEISTNVRKDIIGTFNKIIEEFSFNNNVFSTIIFFHNNF